MASGANAPVGVDALSEAHDPHQTSDVGETAVLAGVGDQQTNRVGAASIAATRVTRRLRKLPGPGTRASRRNRGAAQLPRAARATDSSPSGLTPGPFASECAMRTCRHFTRSGMPPPVKSVPRESISCVPRGRTRVRHGRLRPTRVGVGARRSVISRITPADSCRWPLRSDAGRSGSRGSGRRAVRQPGGGLHDAGWPSGLRTRSRGRPVGHDPVASTASILLGDGRFAHPVGTTVLLGRVPAPRGPPAVSLFRASARRARVR